MTARVVLVVGPALAGVDGLIAAVGSELPEHVVVGAEEMPGQRAPDAVLAVVSAVAPLTRSDWDVVERSAARAGSVIGVVSKIDAHGGWREVLEADRVLVARWHPHRVQMPWVGVAAAPDLGEPRLTELVELLRRRLADPGPETRNYLRGNEIREQANSLGRRGSGAEAAEMRRELQLTRLRLLRFVRDRCSAMRADLRDRASAVPVGGTAGFETVVREEALRFLVVLDHEITRALGSAAAVDERALAGSGPAASSELPDLTRTPSSSRRLEGRLMGVLGVGFGLGIALASSRLLAGLTPGPSIAGLAVGSAIGLALVVWVVRVRGLLHDRALLDRWVTEVAAGLRWHGEATVAERLLVAESACVDARLRRTAGRVGGDPGPGRDVVTDRYDW